MAAGRGCPLQSSFRSVYHNRCGVGGVLLPWAKGFTDYLGMGFRASYGKPQRGGGLMLCTRRGVAGLFGDPMMNLVFGDTGCCLANQIQLGDLAKSKGRHCVN